MDDQFKNVLRFNLSYSDTPLFLLLQRILLLLFCFSLFLSAPAGCKQKPVSGSNTEPVVCESRCFASSVSHYVWAATTRLPENYSRKAGPGRLYVRFFDVVSGPGAEPVPVSSRSSFPEKLRYEIIPVVYITVKSLVPTDPAGRRLLAKRIILKIERMHPGRVKEIQLDCDWTRSTKEGFFEIIREIRRLRPQYQIGVTIRLHQLKYQSLTGIPGADYGVLMLYNTGDVRDYDEPNSILNNRVVEMYLQNSYPLPLKIAVPAFSYAVVFRHGRFDRIIARPDHNEIRKLIRSGSLKEKRAGFEDRGVSPVYHIMQPVQISGENLDAGMKVRYETVSPCQLKRLSVLVSKYLENKSQPELIWFDYDSMQADPALKSLEDDFLIDHNHCKSQSVE